MKYSVPENYKKVLKEKVKSLMEIVVRTISDCSKIYTAKI